MKECIFNIYSFVWPGMYMQYDQCVQYLLNVYILGFVRSVRLVPFKVSILGFVRSVCLLPLARTLRFRRTYRTWCTPDTIFGVFCNFLNSNVRLPSGVRHFLRFLMTNNYANFDLDLLKRTQRRSPTIFKKKHMAGSVRHARLKRLLKRPCLSS